MKWLTQRKQPVIGSIRGGVTAIPITTVGAVSSAATTFAARSSPGGTFRVTDGAAWDLTNAAIGYVAKTSDGFRGLITAVNNAGNYIEVKNWTREGMNDPRSLILPVDTSTVRIHKIDHCKRMVIRADASNSNPFFVGFDANVVATNGVFNQGIEVSDNLLHPTSQLVIPAGMAEYLDATEIYFITAGGAEYALWMAT